MGACLAKPETNSAVAPYVSPVKKRYPKLRLYGGECCPFTSRIRIALEFKGIPVEVLWLNSDDDKETSKQWMAFAMPDGKLPMLQDQDQVISGSADEILDYVEARFPKPSLLGGPSAQKVREWVGYVRDTFSPVLITGLYNGDPVTQHECTMQLNEAYNKFDSAIAKYSSKGPYFFGNQFSFVDVYLIPFLLLTRLLSYFRGIDISPAHNHLVSYRTRMSSFACYAPIRMDLESLQTSVARALTRSGPPPLVALTTLQHQSILGHFGKLVCTADELALAIKECHAKIVDPVKGSISMQIRKLITNYGYLLDFMLEHAQMEECVIFPALEKADRGITKSANQSHANDLPVMNGIKEDLKAVLALDQHTPSRAEALQNVAARLRALQIHTIEHFREEEVDLLPLLNAAGLGTKDQASLLGKCTGIMDSMHKRLFPFFLSGLRPHQIHQYLSLLQRCGEGDNGRMMDACLRGMISALKQSDDEYESIWSLVKERFPAAVASLSDAAHCTV